MVLQQPHVHLVTCVHTHSGNKHKNKKGAICVLPEVSARWSTEFSCDPSACHVCRWLPFLPAISKSRLYWELDLGKKFCLNHVTDYSLDRTKGKWCQALSKKPWPAWQELQWGTEGWLLLVAVASLACKSVGKYTPSIHKDLCLIPSTEQGRF